MVQHAGLEGRIKLIIRKCNNYEWPSETKDRLWACRADEDQQGHQDGPPPGSGTVGLLMHDLKHCGFALDHDVVIQSNDNMLYPIPEQHDLWDMPWQHIKALMFSIASRQRHVLVNAQRTFYGDMKELDYHVFKSAVNLLATKPTLFFSHVATGAFWAEHQLEGIQRSHGLCPNCGVKVESAEHILWDYPCINKHRSINELSHLNSTSLPNAVLNGLPPAVVASIKECPWHLAADAGAHQVDSEQVDPKMRNPQIQYHAQSLGLCIDNLSAGRLSMLGRANLANSPFLSLRSAPEIALWTLMSTLMAARSSYQT